MRAATPTARASTPLLLAVAIVAGAVASLLPAARPVRADANVQVGSPLMPRNVYIAPDITIDAGESVHWTLADGIHNVVEFADAFTSPMMIGSGVTQYDLTFNTPALIGYYCSLHATTDDLDTDGDGAFTAADQPDYEAAMVGRITVLAQEPTNTPIPEPSDTPEVSETPETPSPTATGAPVTATATPAATGTVGSAEPTPPPLIVTAPQAAATPPGASAGARALPVTGSGGARGDAFSLDGWLFVVGTIGGVGALCVAAFAARERRN